MYMYIFDNTVQGVLDMMYMYSVLNRFENRFFLFGDIDK